MGSISIYHNQPSKTVEIFQRPDGLWELAYAVDDEDQICFTFDRLTATDLFSRDITCKFYLGNEVVGWLGVDSVDGVSEITIGVNANWVVISEADFHSLFLADVKKLARHFGQTVKD